MTPTMCTTTRDENASTFLEVRASSASSSKRTRIITRHWQELPQQLERERACGMRNETGFIWLCPLVRRKEPPYGSTYPKIRRDYEQDFQDLASCCQLPHC